MGGRLPVSGDCRQKTQKKKKEKIKKGRLCDNFDAMREENETATFLDFFFGGIIVITAGYNTRRCSVGRMDPRFC